MSSGAGDFSTRKKFAKGWEEPIGEMRAARANAPPLERPRLERSSQLATQFER
jgi:hypothetical protein